MKLLIISESPLEKIGPTYFAVDPWIKIPIYLSDHFEQVTLWAPVRVRGHTDVPAPGSWKVEPGKLRIEHHDAYARYVEYYRLLPKRYFAWRKQADRLVALHDLVILRGPGPITPVIVGASRRQKRPLVFMVLLNIATQSDRLLASRGLKRFFYSAVIRTLIRLEKRAARQARLVYVYSKELAERHGARDGTPRIIQDPHLTLRDLIFREDTCQAEDIRLLRLCWLIPSKGVEHLLEAVALLRSRGRKVRLEIVGQERTIGYQAGLERYARQLGISDRVTFSGWVPFDQVASVYFRNDIQVLSSLGEGTPRCVLEGFARGLPLVATAVGGCKDTLTHEHDALLVPAAHPRAMADAIERLVGDGDLRRKMIRQGYETARLNTFEHLGMRFVEEIKRCITPCQ